MQKRAVRLSILALLLVSALGAAVLTWDIERRTNDVLLAERDVDARVDRLMARAAALGAAQQAAVAPGQAHAEWLSRASALLQQLYDDMTALRPRTRSASAGAALDAFSDSLAAVAKADARAREHLRVDQELMAADVVFSEARQDIEGMLGTLRQLQEAERAAADEQRNALQVQALRVLAAASLTWLAGVLLLVPVRAPQPLVAPERVETPAVPPAAPQATQPAVALDIAEAADVCTALSRITTAGELRELLARAAGVLDASGIIVWLGAGEELFAATAHGYDPRVIARLGPIRRNAENATAAAWRTAKARTVSGEMAANGAIVTPLFGPDGCIGVLTAEVRHGREQDEATRAVTRMIAAQLASVVAAWPAPSVVEAPTAVPADGSESDAASRRAREIRSATA